MWRITEARLWDGLYGGGGGGGGGGLLGGGGCQLVLKAAEQPARDGMAERRSFSLASLASDLNAKKDNPQIRLLLIVCREVRCARPAPAAALACLMRGQASPEVSPWQRQHIDSEGAAQLGSLAGAVCPRPQPPPPPAPPGRPIARPSAVALSPPAPSPCSAPDVLRTRALSPLAAVMREVALRQYSRRGAGTSSQRLRHLCKQRPDMPPTTGASPRLPSPHGPE
ncbi:homeobox protein Hox-D11-like [Schistocerca cancellata]|uniref:homeobox protein Hox-D11-like n=1 Tax=Schistocerca cancellata TaxID=274614 RepID=UPI002118BCAE|nr:homeobox protein Hox-D11-like [Schistocerca cancellata]